MVSYNGTLKLIDNIKNYVETMISKGYLCNLCLETYEQNMQTIDNQ